MKPASGVTGWLVLLVAGVALWVWLLNEPAPFMMHADPMLEHSDRLLAWPLARIAAIDLARDGRGSEIFNIAGVDRLPRLRRHCVGPPALA